MKYFAQLGNRQYQVELNDEDLEEIFLDGRRCRARLYPGDENGVHFFFWHDRTYKLHLKRDRTGCTISLDNRKYFVEVTDEKHQQIQNLIRTDAGEQGRVEIKAPMPGLIVNVSVAEGDEVQSGDGLAVIEAMKMENEIRAQSPGRVSKIFKKAGDSVEKGAVLFFLEG